MKLHLENIGKIKSADVNIGGLTLIAGENDTGKSSVGKVMFGLTMSMVYGEKWYIKTRNEIIKNNIERCNFDNVFTKNILSLEKLEQKRNQELNDVKEWNKHYDILVKDIEKYCSENNKENNWNGWNNKELFKIFQNESDIFNESINKDLRYIFSYKINCALNDTIGEIDFENGQSVKLKVKNNEVSLDNTIENDNKFIFKNATFIETPLVLDSKNRLSDEYRKDRYKKYLIEYHISEELKDLAEKSRDLDYIEERKEIIRDIENKMNLNIIGYNDVYFDNNGNLKFKINNGSQELDILNMASGGKSFSMLKLLILGSYIDYTNQHLIILDEPENHLHPEWQVKYANVIMWLIKNWKCNFIINSHSPYLIQGLVHYAKVYDVDEKDLNFHIANFYENENGKVDKNYSTIRKINNLSEIFNKLVEPLVEVMQNV